MVEWYILPTAKSHDKFSSNGATHLYLRIVRTKIGNTGDKSAPAATMAARRDTIRPIAPRIGPPTA